MTESPRVLFLARPKLQLPYAELLHVAGVLRERGMQPMLAEDILGMADANTVAEIEQSGLPVVSASAASDAQPNWVVVLGGDGAFLGAARRFAPLGASLIGINMGYLGFLTDISGDDVRSSLLDIFDGNYTVEERFMLAVSINGKALSDDLAATVNDIVISRGTSGVLLKLRVYVNDVYAYEMRADGLVVSTPSGSTAYALSAGGPIVSPNLEANLLVPLCPHALTHRPLMVSAAYPIRVEVIEAQSATLHIDGTGDLTLAEGDTMDISRHPTPLKICHPNSYDYYQTLRKKMLWGG